MDGELHEMVLAGRSSAGGEVWTCPSCPRQLEIAWQPEFRRSVLVAGDASARHTGAKGPVRFGSVSVVGAPAAADQRWLRDAGIDWHGVAGPEDRPS